MNSYYYNGHTVLIRPAVLQDAEHIFKMYNRIAITKKNIKSSLVDGKFTQRGGMFETSSLNDITNRIEDKNEKIAIGELDGTPVAMLWYGIADYDIFGNIIADTGYENTVENVTSLIKNGRIGCVKEIISLKNEISHIMPFLLNLEAAGEMKKDSLSQMVCEAFCVKGFDFGNTHYNCDLLNNASANTITANGGSLIGKTPLKKVILKDYNAYITPYIYLWDLDKTINIAKNIIVEKGVQLDEK